MDLIWKLPVIAVIGYLLGNFQTGIMVSKAMGHFDIRHKGSKSAGTTNVLRTMGWVPSLLTLLGDVAKAALAALVGLWLGGGWAGWGGWGARLGGLCAIIGHNWPALFGFQGGKGIAASLGLILVIDPWIALCLVVCQAAVLLITHTMSVASLASAVLYVIMSAALHWGNWYEILFSLAVAALAFWSHRTNIDRLKRKRENKLDFEEIDRISKRRRKQRERGDRHE